MGRGQEQKQLAYVGIEKFSEYFQVIDNNFFTVPVKTCPSLLVPFYGLALCRNKDLNLFFDYSPRNSTFMKFYDIDSKRVTEPMPIDTDCTFKCGPGYYLVGSRSRTCLPLAKWDGLQTTCKR